MPKNDNEIRKEWGYEGKPKQWRQGFDCGLKEIRLAESEKDSKYEKLVEGLKTFLTPINEKWKERPAYDGLLLTMRLPEQIESLITEIEGGENDKAK